MRKFFIKQLVNSNKNKNNYLLINDLGYNVIEPFKKKIVVNTILNQIDLNLLSEIKIKNSIIIK